MSAAPCGGGTACGWPFAAPRGLSVNCWRLPPAVPIEIATAALIVCGRVLRGSWVKAQIKSSAIHLLPSKLAHASVDLALMPGGLGSTEVPTATMFAFQGVGFDLAITAAILMRLMTLCLVFGVGVLCLGLGRKSFIPPRHLV